METEAKTLHEARIEVALLNMGFRSTCAAHRREFVERLFEAGVEDWEIMELARLKFIIKAARHFSEGEMFALLNNRCVACDHEGWTWRTVEKVIDEVRLYMRAGVL